MSTTLILKETPQSCMVCPLRVVCSIFADRRVSDYPYTRHPNCPLKITEDNLRWEIIDLGTTQRITGHRCPKCGDEKYTCKFNYCPNCGVKLLPPEEKL